MIKIKYVSKHNSSNENYIDLPLTLDEYLALNGDSQPWLRDFYESSFNEWKKRVDELRRNNNYIEDHYWKYYLLEDNDPCFHEYKRYVGFLESYDYCIKCDIKRFK